MTLKQNLITDWLKENGNPEIEIQVLNEVIDKLVEERDNLLKQKDEFAIEFAEWVRGFRYDNAELYFISSTKELLEIYKKEKEL